MSSVTLQPQANFPIIRQIANHLDSTTYYVRAVVRNADGNIIDTVNLASQGSQRYQSRYRVPVDSSGQGAYISIITSVYTDSGYTTKSPNYGDEENTYLVFDRVLSGRGGSGGSLDIGTIRRVVAEELEKAKPEEKPEEVEVEEPEKPDTITPKLEKLATEIKSLQTAVNKIPTDTLDLSDIKQAMETIYTAINDKEVTPVTDLSPAVEAVDQLATDILQQVEGVRQDAIKAIGDMKTEVVTSIKENMKDAKFVNELHMEVGASSYKPSSPQPAQVAYDMSKLAS